MSSKILAGKRVSGYVGRRAFLCRNFCQKTSLNPCVMIFADTSSNCNFLLSRKHRQSPPPTGTPCHSLESRAWTRIHGSLSAPPRCRLAPICCCRLLGMQRRARGEYVQTRLRCPTRVEIRDGHHLRAAIERMELCVFDVLCDCVTM